MSNNIVIDRWVDIDSQEFKDIQDASMKAFTMRAIRCGAVAPDKDGNLYTTDANKFPIHDTINGKAVGFRYSSKAAN